MRSGNHRRRLVLHLNVVAPIVVTFISFSSTVFLLFLAETEFRLFDHGSAPEDAARIVGIAVVVVLSSVVTVIAYHLMTHAGPQKHVGRCSGWLVEALSLASLATLGTAFAVLDMTFCIGESTDGVLIALILGLGAVAPVFLKRAVRVRKLLLGIGVYCIFACWIVDQRAIDWNMHRHFLRAYSEIRPGMTVEQLQGVIHRHFRVKRPVARFDDWGAQYTLDPDDGRFNSEFITIYMNDKKVVSASYFPD